MKNFGENVIENGNFYTCPVAGVVKVVTCQRW